MLLTLVVWNLFGIQWTKVIHVFDCLVFMLGLKEGTKWISRSCELDRQALYLSFGLWNIVTQFVTPCK